jgi:hypothetical protein
MGDLRTAIVEADESEVTELAAFVMGKFNLVGHRIEEPGGFGWDLDIHDFARAIREFAQLEEATGD